MFSTPFNDVPWLLGGKIFFIFKHEVAQSRAQSRLRPRSYVSNKPWTVLLPSPTAGTRKDKYWNVFRVQSQLPSDIQIHGVFDGYSVPHPLVSTPQPNLSFTLGQEIDEDRRPRASTCICFGRWRWQRFTVADDPELREPGIVYLALGKDVVLENASTISPVWSKLDGFTNLGLRFGRYRWTRMFIRLKNLPKIR